MRTTVDLDSQLLKRLRAEAARRGVPFREVLAGAIRRGLESPPESTRRKYKAPTFSMGAAASSVNVDKALAIAAGIEDEEVEREIALRK